MAIRLAVSVSGSYRNAVSEPWECDSRLESSELEHLLLLEFDVREADVVCTEEDSSSVTVRFDWRSSNTCSSTLSVSSLLSFCSSMSQTDTVSFPTS